jgi:hypothetical protein
MPTTEYRILLDGEIKDVSFSKIKFESMLNIYYKHFGKDRVTTEIIDLI